jgi:hypothetical protein
LRLDNNFAIRSPKHNLESHGPVTALHDIDLLGQEIRATVRPPLVHSALSLATALPPTPVRPHTLHRRRARFHTLSTFNTTPTSSTSSISHYSKIAQNPSIIPRLLSHGASPTPPFLLDPEIPDPLPRNPSRTSSARDNPKKNSTCHATVPTEPPSPAVSKSRQE